MFVGAEDARQHFAHQLKVSASGTLPVKRALAR
ncbi:Uncharacterised protein [Bordetella pertussis]|nr:Uncharacterised protein [Bordetella pertussis]